jgi:hypothetical protein
MLHFGGELIFRCGVTAGSLYGMGTLRFVPTGSACLVEDSNGGASRARTDGLVVANDALSQLSYSPTDRMVCWFANSFYQRSFLHTTLSRYRPAHVNQRRG